MDYMQRVGREAKVEVHRFPTEHPCLTITEYFVLLNNSALEIYNRSRQIPLFGLSPDSAMRVIYSVTRSLLPRNLIQRKSPLRSIEECCATFLSISLM